MFATCIFCHNALGSNDALEHFPVGKRLAFDASKGRLWVVCSSCTRWNLSPLEERWEAIEEAERAYRDTTKRVATDNIGLARLADRTDLIRIGKPLRPEFAAWRYGNRFAKRRQRSRVAAWSLFAGGAGAAAVVAHMTGGVAGVLPYLNTSVALGLALYNRAINRTMIVTHNARRTHIKRTDQHNITFRFDKADGTPLLRIPRRFGMNGGRLKAGFFECNPFGRLNPEIMEFAGTAALDTISRIIPTLNGTGGKTNDIDNAVARVEHDNNPVGLLKQSTDRPAPFGGGAKMNVITLFSIPPAERLALEMMLHEDDERRALEGELHLLEQRWKDAEEIAAIADALTLPEQIDQRLGQLREPKVK